MRPRIRASLVVIMLVALSIAVPPAPVTATTDLPVVLVHGLHSSASTWDSYVGPTGLLATIGRQGFAVGDGQAPGVLRTGDLAEPFSRTYTIAENAAVLRDYIAGVKESTGAARVDLVAHSMGGLISRFYIDRLMRDRDVNRLIMLGTPNGGSSCAILPASLGISTPATVELRPSYVRDVFNRQVNRRNGVPFHPLAGTAFVNALQSPCAAVPSDLVVSLGSVEAVGVAAQQISVAHTDLPGSVQVFETLVAPLLSADAPPADDLLGGAAPDDQQFVALSVGHVEPGGASQEIINIDEDVAVASFAIYDPTRSLRVSVHGASGDLIHLDPGEHGVVTVDDPATLVHLGYGFDRPRPGPWRVTMHATAQTPPDGADFAVTAQVTGGAVLTARTSELLPAPGQRVRISAALERDGRPIPVERAFAVVRDPDGQAETVDLTGATELVGTWQPRLPGLHSIDVVTIAEPASGTAVHRVAFLAAEVRPDQEAAWATLIRRAGMVAIVLILAAVVLLGGFGLLRLRRR